MRVSARERRQHVRVRPTADYEVRVELVDGVIATPLQVVDISVGGLGLLVDGIVSKFGVGRELTLRIASPRAAAVSVKAIVRHVSPIVSVCGVELVSLGEDARHAIERTVSELLERGALT